MASIVERLRVKPDCWGLRWRVRRGCLNTPQLIYAASSSVLLPLILCTDATSEGNWPVCSRVMVQYPMFTMVAVSDRCHWVYVYCVSLSHFIKVTWYFTEIWQFDFIESTGCQPCWIVEFGTICRLSSPHCDVSVWWAEDDWWWLCCVFSDRVSSWAAGAGQQQVDNCQVDWSLQRNCVVDRIQFWCSAVTWQPWYDTELAAAVGTYVTVQPPSTISCHGVFLHLSFVQFVKCVKIRFLSRRCFEERRALLWQLHRWVCRSTRSLWCCVSLYVDRCRRQQKTGRLLRAVQHRASLPLLGVSQHYFQVVTANASTTTGTHYSAGLMSVSLCLAATPACSSLYHSHYKLPNHSPKGQMEQIHQT